MTMAKILPGLWMGSTPNIFDILRLYSHNVKAIVSISKRRDWCPFLFAFKRFHIGASDRTTEDIRYWFRSIFHFIEENRNTGVLIYCRKGNSLCAAVVIGYLMWRYEITLADAFLRVYKQLRVDIKPIFIKQLLEFEKSKFNIYLLEDIPGSNERDRLLEHVY